MERRAKIAHSSEWEERVDAMVDISLSLFENIKPVWRSGNASHLQIDNSMTEAKISKYQSPIRMTERQGGTRTHSLACRRKRCNHSATSPLSCLLMRRIRPGAAWPASASHSFRSSFVFARATTYSLVLILCSAR
eukprot:scaffold6547_cov76-Skeletonema_marinoi.AAC.2